MTTMVPMHRADVKVLDLWNGSSNNAEPYDFVNDPAVDFRTTTYDDSGWANSANPSGGASSAMQRFTLNSASSSPTYVTPDAHAGEEAAWPTTTPANSKQEVILRWHFNPGPGPFTNAELRLSASTGVSHPPSISLWLNWDGTTGGSGHGISDSSMIWDQPSQSITIFTSAGPTETWASALKPNQDNVLSVLITPDFRGSWAFDAWFAAAWAFPQAYEIVVVSTAGKEKTFALGTAPANWETVAFNDSAWNDSVAESADNSVFYTAVSGAAWVTDTARNGNQGGLPGAEFLIRRKWYLDPGVTGATLEINFDDELGNGSKAVDWARLYLNGSSLLSGDPRSAGTPIAPATLTIPLASLNTGSTPNVLAADVFSPGGEVCLSYKFTATAAAVRRAQGHAQVIG